MKESEKSRYEKKIKELEEKIKKLKSEKQSNEAETDASFKKDGAAGIYESLDRMLNLSGLINSTEKLPEIQEKIKLIDNELKRKFKSIPLKRTPDRGSYRKGGFQSTPFGTMKSKRGRETPIPKEREVDIFDEDNFMLVIYEIPGVEEKTIDVVLKRDKLAILAVRAGKNIQKEIILPCVPRGETTKNYKNGILEIKINKNK